MECDEERDAETEDDERDEEVTVGEDGSGLVEEFHGCGMCWDNRKDGAGGVSRMVWEARKTTADLSTRFACSR